MGYGHAFRHEVHNESITPLIGIFDMYSASLAAQHYCGMFVSGFGFAASYYRLPGIGFIA
jgi:2-methylisocitrate lyase-like PEP mutase family enzyme